jgi:integrase/recombinase XerD
MSTKPEVPTVYRRVKIENKGWRYQRVEVGKGHKTGDLTGPFYKLAVVGTKANGRPNQQWLPLDGETYAEAVESAKTAVAVLDAQRQGLTVAQAQDITNASRTPVKAARDQFISETQKTKSKKTLAAYTLHLDQFIAANKKIHFIDEITTSVLRGFRDFLAGEGFSDKTQHNRMVTILSLLKKHGIKTDFSLADDLQTVDETPARPYTAEELKKLFAAMSDEDKLIYKFFLSTACRAQEVSFAAWADIDFTKRTYHICPKKDAGFTVKNHEVRTVQLPAELVELLKEHKKTAPKLRWIFTNEDGGPDNHFLRKLKKIALRAGLNCGHCKTTVTKGKYEGKKEVEVTCATDPVCKNFYLHRFRKTCATRWSSAAIPVRDIQILLGHKSLETTQIYLGGSNLGAIQSKFDAAFSD